LPGNPSFSPVDNAVERLRQNKQGMDNRHYNALRAFTTVDPDQVRQGAGVLKNLKIKRIIDVATKLRYLALVLEMVPVPGQEHDARRAMGTNGYFTRPRICETTGLPVHPIADWSHVLKHHRIAICEGKDPSKSTLLQQQRYKAIIKMARHSKESWITLHEMNGMHKQNVSLAQRLFSIKTARMLREVGEEETAEYVEIMANGLIAYDKRGHEIPVRKEYLRKCRDYLLEGVDLFNPGSHVKGVSFQTWKNTIVACDSFLRLCDTLEDMQAGLSARLCPRALSSDDVENFFSIMRFDTKGMFEVNLYKIIRVLQIRSDPKRGFHFVHGKTLGRIPYWISGKGFNDPENRRDTEFCSQAKKNEGLQR
jgi:hypothetical protein